MTFRRDLPNYLTYLRILLIPAMVVTFYLPGDLGYILTASLFLLAGITDWLDGYLARAWQAQSNIGRFLDPIADKLLVATALVLLVSGGTLPTGEEMRETIEEGRIDVIPAIAIVCREILVSGLREFLAELHVGMPVSRLAKWKTGIQMTAIFLLFLAVGGPGWLQAGVIGNGLIWLAAVFTLVTGFAYLRTGLKHMG